MLRLPPAHHVRDFVVGGGVDGGVEDHVQPAFRGDHVGVVLAQFVELVLGLALPVRAVLVAVDVHGEAGQAGLLQLVQQFGR